MLRVREEEYTYAGDEDGRGERKGKTENRRRGKGKKKLDGWIQTKTNFLHTECVSVHRSHATLALKTSKLINGTSKMKKCIAVY